MMKLSCNYLSLSDLDIKSFIQTVFELRLDAIDFHTSGFKSQDPGYLREIRSLCLELGLSIGYIGVSPGFVGSPEDLRLRVSAAKSAIDLAEVVGSPMIRVFGGHVPDQINDWNPLYQDLYTCLSELAQYGVDKGVVVALQNHDNNNLAATAENVIQILDAVDHPNLSHIMDTGQWKGSIGAATRGEFDPTVDIYQQMEKTIRRAIYVRTKFYRIENGREEWLDYPRIVNILHKANFNGNLSIVYEGDEEDRIGAVRKAAAHLRPLL